MDKLRSALRTLSLFYPVVVLLTQGRSFFLPLTLALGAILALALISRLSGGLRYAAAAGLLLLIVLLAGVAPDRLVRVYPFLMSASMLLLFASTKNPEDNPMIGPFRARVLADPALLAAMHQAKAVWVIGLAVNTALLGGLLLQPDFQIWLRFASFYSYILLAALFVVSIAVVAVRRRSGVRKATPDLRGRSAS